MNSVNSTFGVNNVPPLFLFYGLIIIPRFKQINGVFAKLGCSIYAI